MYYEQRDPFPIDEFLVGAITLATGVSIVLLILASALWSKELLFSGITTFIAAAILTAALFFYSYNTAA